MCTTLQIPQSEHAEREVAVEELLLVYSKQNTIQIPSHLENLKILHKQCPTEYLGDQIFLCLCYRYLSKLKCVPLAKGTQIIRGLGKKPDSQESCAVTTRKPTLFAILPALV